MSFYIPERDKHYELRCHHISVDCNVLRFRNVKRAGGFQILFSGYLNQSVLQLRGVVSLNNARACMQFTR
jgi:hypothetical protein